MQPVEIFTVFLFGFVLSTLFSDAGVVMALVPVLIIPFLLVGGFFVPLENVFEIFYPFEYLSMFRYGFEAMVYSQYETDRVTITLEQSSEDPQRALTGRQVLSKYYNFEVFLPSYRLVTGGSNCCSWPSLESSSGSWPCS